MSSTASTNPIVSECKAIVMNPNPTVVHSMVPSNTFTPQPSTVEDRVEMFQDLKAVELDPNGKWDPSIFNGMLIGMYIPIKYVISTNDRNYDRKSLPVRPKDAIGMNLPIREGIKVDKSTNNKSYEDPQILFSLHPTNDALFLNDLQEFEKKINDMLTANMATIKDKQKQAKIAAANGRSMKKDPKDDEVPKFNGVIKKNTQVDQKTNKETTYINLSTKISDYTYKKEICEANKLELKESKDGSGYKPTVPFRLYFESTMETGKFQLKRDINDNLLSDQYRDMTLKEVIADQLGNTKAEKGAVRPVSARPTISFGRLYYFFKENAISIRSYLRACSFVERPKRARKVPDMGMGDETVLLDDQGPSKRPRLATSNVRTEASSSSSSSSSSVAPMQVEPFSGTHLLRPDSNVEEMPQEPSSNLNDGEEL
jgi:hypothetical protein